MGRIYRQGQAKPCSIYRLFTSGTVEEIIFQRQSQKCGIATLTVDAGNGKSGRNESTQYEAKFTKEELADCFTLKVDCACDTKLKVRSRWPDYDEGGRNLRSLGCNDQPLLAIAASLPNDLRFVHIVTGENETEDLSCSAYSCDDNEILNDDSENEF